MGGKEEKEEKEAKEDKSLFCFNNFGFFFACMFVFACFETTTTKINKWKQKIKIKNLCFLGFGDNKDEKKRRKKNNLYFLRTAKTTNLLKKWTQQKKKEVKWDLLKQKDNRNQI